jgi:hypothetical protein
VFAAVAGKLFGAAAGWLVQLLPGAVVSDVLVANW